MRSMNWTWRLMLTCVASLGLSGAVRAELATFIFVNEPVPCNAFGPCGEAQGSAVLEFSGGATQALQDAGVDLSAGSRGGEVVTSETGALMFSSEIGLLGGIFDSEDSWFSYRNIRTSGDLTLSMPGDGLERTGGALTIRDLSMRPFDGVIHASLVDASGVEVQRQIPLLTFANREGAGGFLMLNGEQGSVETFTGLAFTEPGLDLFASMLGLSANDKATLAGMTDLGTVRAFAGASVSGAFAPVPEPSTWALMVLGLSAMAWRVRGTRLR